MRIAKGTAAGEPTLFHLSGNAGNHVHLQRLGGVQRRQKTGHPRREHRLAGTGRPRHQQVMAARRRNLQRPFCGLLPLDILQLQEKLFVDNLSMFWWCQNLISLEMIDQGKQAGRRQHLQIARPSRFGARCRRADNVFVFSHRGDSGRQDPAYRIAAAIQRQFPQHIIFLQLIRWQDVHGCQDTQRNRKIIMRAFLRQIRRGEVDGNTFGRQADAKGGERRAHPLLTLRDGFIRKADNGERREP